MTHRSSIATRALVCLVVAALLGAGTVAVAATPAAGATVLNGDTAELSVAPSVDETLPDLDGTVNDTTDDLDNETDGIENTTNETTEEVENTTDETTDEVENTTETTSSDGDLESETTLEGTTEDTTQTLDDSTTLLEDGHLESSLTGTIDADLEASVGETSETNETADDGSDRDEGNGTEADSDDGDDGDDAGASSGTSAATDAVLVGLLGVITASGAAASGAGASGGTTSAVANWIGQSGGLRRLRRAGSILPWEVLPIFRYSRYDDSDPLANDRRRAVYETIEDDPGCYLSQVSEQSGVALSTVRHHVRILEDEGLVTAAKVNGKRRYFLASDGADAAELHAALEEPAKREVLEALADLGTAHNGRLADELDRDPSTVSHHLSALEDDGLIVREKDGRAMLNELAPEAEAALCGDSQEDEEAESTPPAAADD